MLEFSHLAMISASLRSSEWTHLIGRFSEQLRRKNHASTSPAAHTTNLSLNDPVLAQRFLEEDRTLTLRNARIGCWFVILIAPFCSILDILSYPQHFYPFLALRIATSLIGIALLLSIHRPFGFKHYRLYPVVLPLVPSLFICYMIYLSQDPGSHYYAGLCFCMVATSFVFNWTFREIGLTLSTIVVAYLAATIPHILQQPQPEVINMFFSNMTFMLLNFVVLVATCFQHQTIRISEFLARQHTETQHAQIRRQNEELISTIGRLHETEAQLGHSDRLASIGRLSAGIIHEINNPLNFVKSALYVLNKKAKSLPPQSASTIQEISHDLAEGVDRVVAIVSDLRTFAHPEQRALHPVDLASVLQKAERFLSKELNDQHVRFSIHSDPGLYILGDDREVLQVLINLIQNSIDAIRGSLKPRIVVCAWRDKQLIHVSVEDNGSGITQEQIAHIFDPFYTTKEVGKGMGLGLSICYRMMQQMEGDIDVESVPGDYTRFTLSFQPAKHHANQNTGT
jgi:two-component system, sensor histidine kinase PhcS